MRRFTWLAAALGLALALALTYPLPLALGSAFLEDGSYDAYQFAWNLWWAGESVLRLHTNPFYTHYLFFPEGVPLLFHTFSFSLGLASLPLQALFGLVTAHNLLVVAAPALTFLVVALLAREVTGDGWAAVVGGVAATVNPVAAWFVPVLYLSCTYLIAALLLAWWRLQRRRRGSDVALTLVVLAVLMFASQEYAVIALGLLALDTVLRFVLPRLLGLDARWGRGTLAFWLLAAAGLGGLALVALSAPAKGPPPLQLYFASGYGAGLVIPPWLEAPPVRFWSVLYLGTVPLLLLPFAVGLGGRRVGYWLVATVVTALMALGPYMNWHHPLVGLKTPPTEFHATGLPGPYLLAMQLVPLLEFFRAPYRWVVGAQVTFAIVTAVAVAALRSRIAAPAPRAALSVALLVLVLAGGAFDSRGLRAPVTPVGIPAAYDAIRRDPDPAAIVELPSGFVVHGFAVFSSLYMFHQTAHRKFLLEGTVARLPPGRRLIVQRSFDDLLLLPYVKYVVVHHDLFESAHPASRQQAESVEARLRTEAALVVEDGPITIYRLPTFRPESVAAATVQVAM
jgi:hypothetical protein